MNDITPIEKEWAIFVYFAADVDAEFSSAAEKHLAEIGDVGSNDQVYLAAQIDLVGRPTWRYILPPRPANLPASKLAPDPSLASGKNLNSASPKTILDFFTWASTACPAKNTMLVLYGHGTGIDDYLFPGTRERKLSGFRPVPFPAPPALPITPASGSTAEELIPADESGDDLEFRLVSILPDTGHRSVLRDYQVGAIVRTARAMLPEGRNLAILGFEACEMAMAEIWCEMEGAADIAIGSEAELPFTGWPYPLFLRSLLAEPESDPGKVAAMLLKAFEDYYDGHRNEYVTLSSCDLTQCKDLTDAVGPLAKALTEAADSAESRARIFRARDAAPLFDPDGFIDLGCFCQFLQITMPNTKVSEACVPTLEALGEFVTGKVYSPLDDTRKIAQTTGLAVWFPPWIENPTVDYDQKWRSVKYLEGGYNNTGFAQATGWNKFLLEMLKYTPDAKTDSRMTEAAMADDTTDQPAGNSGGNGDLHETLKNLHDALGKVQDALGRVTGVQGRVQGVQGRVTGVQGRVQGVQGRVTGVQGRVQGVQGRVTGVQGRAIGLQSREGDSQGFVTGAGVVVTAAVEPFGLPGDTELNISVKWPATTLGLAVTEVVGDADTTSGTHENSPIDSHGNLKQKKTTPKAG